MQADDIEWVICYQYHDIGQGGLIYPDFFFFKVPIICDY